MKKFVSAIISFLLVLSALTLPVLADGISVTLNGQAVTFDVQPTIINDRTMVPMRAVFEKLGADVRWDNATKTVTAQKYAAILNITINSDVMFKNSEPIKLDSPAVILDGRTLVPVRAIAEAFDCFVDWDADTQTVIIETEEYSVLRAVANKKTDEIEIIEASTAFELVNAVGSNRKIVLTADDYNLTDVFGDSYFYFEIDSVTNLTIEGEAEILTEALYTDVIRFTNCTDITLKGFTAGHIKPNEEYECEGDVLSFYNCMDITLENCTMFGCGASGINTTRVKNLTADGCTIYGCTYSSVWLSGSDNIVLTGTEIRDNKTLGATFALLGSSLNITNCNVHGNIAYGMDKLLFEMFDYDIASEVLVQGTTFEDNEYSEIIGDSDDRVVFADCTFR